MGFIRCSSSLLESCPARVSGRCHVHIERLQPHGAYASPRSGATVSMFQCSSTQRTGNGWLAHLATFRLRADSLMARRPEMRRVSGLPKAARVRPGTLIGIWDADSLTDSIRVSATDGFQGVSLVLAPTNAEWQGRVSSFTDFGPQRVHEFGHVCARPMSCADTAAPNAPAGSRSQKMTKVLAPR